jgi:hypothetical protein
VRLRLLHRSTARRSSASTSAAKYGACAAFNVTDLPVQARADIGAPRQVSVSRSRSEPTVCGSFARRAMTSICRPQIGLIRAPRLSLAAIHALMAAQ